MIIVFPLTQFVLLTLGTIFLKGMVNANGDISSSLYFQFLDQNWLWFFLLPVAWTAYALVSYNVNKGPFTPAVARILGIALSGFCLLFFASVMFFPSAYCPVPEIAGMLPAVGWLFFKAVRAGRAQKRSYLSHTGRARNAEQRISPDDQ